MDEKVDLNCELGQRNRFGFQTEIRVVGKDFTDKLMQERIDAHADEINAFMRLHPELRRGQWNG